MVANVLLLSRGVVICCCVFVRLSRAATAYKWLSADDQSTYDNITPALKKRIEPECRKELYIAGFQHWKKRRSKD